MRIVAVLCLSLVVTACVTEGPPRERPEPELAKAAVLNVQLGYQYLRAGQRAEAIDKFAKAAEQDPDNAQARLGMAYVYEQAGDLDAARGHYRDAVARAKGDAAVQSAWGTFLCRQGKYAEADEVLVGAARDVRFRTPEVVWTTAGMCARQAGDLARAEAHLREALKSNPRYFDALFVLAEVSFARGDALRTRAFVTRLLEDHRPTAAVLALGARAERRLGDAAAAERLTRRLRQEFPDAPETRALDGGR